MSKIPKHNPNQIELVEQRKKTDCGIACVAMLTYNTYYYILGFTRCLGINIKKGLFPEQMFLILEELNFECISTDKISIRKPSLIALSWKDKNCNNGHYVIFDVQRNKILDPLFGIYNLKELKKCAEIEFIWGVRKLKKPRN